MSGLTNRVTGGGRKAAMVETFIGHENGDGMPNGISLPDGTSYELQGQPPVAATHGWGNLSFLWFDRTRQQ